jgi:hypothetical protein
MDTSLLQGMLTVFTQGFDLLAQALLQLLAALRSRLAFEQLPVTILHRFLD